MGELRPSRESAERFLALGLTDQRRPLYEVLEVELLRADALGSSNNKNEEAKSPDKKDWPPSGVGTETGNTSNRGTALLNPFGRRAFPSWEGPSRDHADSMFPSDRCRDGGEDQRPEHQERIFLEGEHREVADKQEATDDQLQGSTRQGGRAGQGPNDVHRPLEQNNKQEEDLLEGEDQRPENQERIFLDPFDRRALPPGAGPLRAGPEGGRPTTGQPEQTELNQRIGS